MDKFDKLPEQVKKGMDSHRIHFLMPSKYGQMGLWMSQEDIATVLKMEEKYPGKYKGGEGVLQALIDSQK